MYGVCSLLLPNYPNEKFLFILATNASNNFIHLYFCSARDIERVHKSRSSAYQDANRLTPEKETPSKSSPHKKHKYLIC